MRAVAHRICAFGTAWPSRALVRAAFSLSAAPGQAAAFTRPSHDPCDLDPARVEQLRSCVVTGLTCSQIAAEIGVSRNAVIGKIHRLGLASGRPAVALGAFLPSTRPAPAGFAATPGFAADVLPKRRAWPRRVRCAVPVESAEPCSLLDLYARQMPLAARQRSGRDEFCLLRERGDQGLLLLCGPCPHGLSDSGAAARLASVAARRT